MADTVRDLVVAASRLPMHVLAAAVCGRARYLVAYDQDILELQNPYGVSCVTPRAFPCAVLSS